jgi:hypothetical protein
MSTGVRRDDADLFAAGYAELNVVCVVEGRVPLL